MFGVSQLMSAEPAFTIRPAVESDLETVLELIRALAAYEKLERDCTATSEGLRKMLFGAKPFGQCLLALVGEKAAGFAVYFFQFSTFRAAPVLYLEDIFVYPEFRQRGIGRALFEMLRGEAVRQGCARFQWSVLDWNTPSIRFYESLGAKASPEWVRFGIEF